MKGWKGRGPSRRARLAALFEFLEARTPAEIRRSLDRHPELLDDETDALIAGMLRQARDAGRTDIAAGLEERRALLARERTPARGGEHEGELPARVRAMIAEIGELTGPGESDRRIDLLKQVLADPAVRPHAQLRAALSGFLGSSLADRCDRLGSGDYAEAISALEVAFDAPPGASTASSRRQVAFDLGRLYVRHATGNPRDNVEAAIRYLTEALHLGNDQTSPADTAEVHAQLARAYLNRVAGTRAGNVREAIGHLEAAGQFFTRQANPDEWAAIQGSLGVAYLDHAEGEPAQNIEKAIDYLTTARRHLAGRGPAPAGAAAAHNLGNAYLHRQEGKPADNAEMAIGLFEEALGVRTAQEYPLDRAATSLSLGNAYLIRGYGERADNTEQAIAYYLAARDAFASLGAGREEGMARLRLAEAYFRRVLSDPADEDSSELAVENLEAAEGLFSAFGTLEERAAALTGLGVAVSERTTGEPGAAAGLAIGYHEAAKQALGERDTSPELWAMIQNNLGTAYLERGQRGAPGHREDLSSAIECLADALAGGAGRSPLEQAMTRHNLGAAYAERARDRHDEDLRQAVGYLQAALDAFASTGLPAYQRGTGQALGDAYARLGDHWTEALAAYESALAAAGALYVTSLSRSARQAELSETPALHVNAAYAAARAGQVERAAVIAERGRARSLGEALARDQAELGRIRQQSKDLADEFAAAAARLRELEAAESLGPALVPAAGGGIAAAGRGGLRQRLGAAQGVLADVIGRIRLLDDHERFLAEPEFADLAAVAHAAGPLAYLAACAEGSLTLLIISRDGASLTSGQLTARVEAVPEPGEPLTRAALRALVIGGDVPDGYLPAQLEMTERPDRFRVTLTRLLPVLGERLTGPLADALARRRADRVTLIACGLLGVLPLHAASYQRGHEARCLLSDYAVAYAPSARVLGAARSVLGTQRKRGLMLAGVASPAGTGELPYAEKELRQIAAWFPPSGSRAFTGTAATRANLLSAAAGATHVHFACHGAFEPVTPVDSALLLSQDDRADPLTLQEIMASRPFKGARLVVASACQTAMTDFADMPDEAIGLPAGFLSAGTPGVVGTLWPVNDRSMALLMCRFYELHLGRAADQPAPLSPALALREAQLWLARLTTEQLNAYFAQHEELRDTVSGLAAARSTVDSSVAAASSPGRPYAHPYHWASCVFVGA